MKFKKFANQIAAILGYRIIKDSNDATLEEMLLVYDELRSNPNDFVRWDHSFTNLARASHLRVLFAELQPDVLIDVGANRGQFAISARELGFKGTIISFEPQLALFENLSALASKDGNWIVHPFGLGAKQEELALNICADNSFSSVLTLSDKAVENFGQYGFSDCDRHD